MEGFGSRSVQIMKDPDRGGPKTKDPDPQHCKQLSFYSYFCSLVYVGKFTSLVGSFQINIIFGICLNLDGAKNETGCTCPEGEAPLIKNRKKYRIKHRDIHLCSKNTFAGCSPF